jgi:hypothetical protein
VKEADRDRLRARLLSEFTVLLDRALDEVGAAPRGGGTGRGQLVEDYKNRILKRKSKKT